MPVVIAYLMITFFIYFRYMKTQREVTRIEAMSKSPILSFFNEIAKGAIYARTCLKETFIHKQHSFNINLDLRNTILKTGLRSFFISHIIYLLIPTVSLIMIITVKLF